MEDAFSVKPSKSGAEVRAQLEKAVEPVREALRKAYGDEFVVYRSQGPVEPGARTRNVLSYTLDKKFVKHHAGVRKNLKKVSEEEIARAEKELAQNGEAEIAGRTLKSEKVKFEGQEFDSINMYKDGDFVADVDGIRSVASDHNAFVDQIQGENIRAAKQIGKRKAKVDDVIWATNRAGQWEVMLKPRGAKK
jgi:hypothetical protein